MRNLIDLIDQLSLTESIQPLATDTSTDASVPSVQPASSVDTPDIKDQQLDQLLMNKINNLAAAAIELPNDSPVKENVLKLLTDLANFENIDQTTLSEDNDDINDHLNALAALGVQAIKSLPSRIKQWYIAKLTKEIELTDAEAARIARYIRIHPNYKKAEKSLVKTIQMDTEGKIVMQDTELEQYAQEVANRLGLDYKWALNLVGMFGVQIKRKDKLEFLDLCRQHKAINLDKMLLDKKGKLSDLIVKDPPSIRQVFQHIKDTLLGISISSGRRDATGPFEAMLCIMGPATKLTKGDISINNQNFEVKGSSISINARGNPSRSFGWLEANSIKASALHKVFAVAVENILPGSSQITTQFLENDKPLSLKSIIDRADFRTERLPYLKYVLSQLPNRSDRITVMTAVHTTLFPSTAQQKIRNFNFLEKINQIVDAIADDDAGKIAKIQGIMGMLEYYFSVYKSGMIYYNSSDESYLVLNSPEDILNSSSELDFIATATMHGDKSGPGIYSGKSPQQMSDYINDRRLQLGIGKAYRPRDEKKSEGENKNQLAQPLVINEPPANIQASTGGVAAEPMGTKNTMGRTYRDKSRNKT